MKFKSKESKKWFIGEMKFLCIFFLATILSLILTYVASTVPKILVNYMNYGGQATFIENFYFEYNYRFIAFCLNSFSIIILIWAMLYRIIKRGYKERKLIMIKSLGISIIISMIIMIGIDYFVIEFEQLLSLVIGGGFLIILTSNLLQRGQYYILIELLYGLLFLIGLSAPILFTAEEASGFINYYCDRSYLEKRKFDTLTSGFHNGSVIGSYIDSNEILYCKYEVEDEIFTIPEKLDFSYNYSDDFKVEYLPHTRIIVSHTSVVSNKKEEIDFNKPMGGRKYKRQ